MIIQQIRGLLLFSLISLCIGIASASDKAIEFIGEYSHIESSTGEHCKGYSVTLWKHLDSLVGFLHHHRGLCGDPPMGTLENISYSASTGRLSFNVKLSDGSVFKVGSWVPSKDIVTFKGILQGQMLEGLVTWSLDGKALPSLNENVVLKAESPAQSHHQSFENYDEWNQYWGPILKLRGPRW